MVSNSINALALLVAALGICSAPSGFAGNHSASEAHTASAANPAMKIDWVLKPTNKSLEREALITISDRIGKPVSNAKVTISLDMPSMPGAHHVPPVPATATGSPGRYTALLQLEMAGDWTARIEMSAPQRLKVHKKFNVD
jgi:hypothetical protein